MNKKQIIIDVNDGSITGFKQPLHPDMLRGKGFKVKSSVKGTYFRYGKEYVQSYLSHQLKRSLGLHTLEDAKELLEPVFA